jgi:hypothetical protein
MRPCSSDPRLGAPVQPRSCKYGKRLEEHLAVGRSSHEGRSELYPAYTHIAISVLKWCCDGTDAGDAGHRPDRDRSSSLNYPMLLHGRIALYDPRNIRIRTLGISDTGSGRREWRFIGRAMVQFRCGPCPRIDVKTCSLRQRPLALFGQLIDASASRMPLLPYPSILAFRWVVSGSITV